MQGTSLTKQERECKLYDAFDKFTHIKGESLHLYYLRFTQLINDINIYNMKLEQFQINTKFLNSLPPEWSKFVTDVKLVKDLLTTNFDQLYAYLEQHELHANKVRLMRERNQDPLARGDKNSYATGTSGIRANTSGTGGNYSGTGKVLTEEELEFLADLGIAEGPVTLSVITHNETYQADDLDAYDFDYDEISTAKAVLMANLSSYESDVLSAVPISDNTNNDMLNQSGQEMSYSEPSHFVEHSENEIHSDSNIIPYSQYLIESQTAAVQDINSSAQQDALILSVFEQLSNQVTNCNKVNNDNLIANETLSVEFERYKEREKEAKNIDTEIALEKKVKELDNIVCKMGQSTKTVHMLTKPQVFYDNNLKQALGFQNPFYHKKAHQISPMLYDGNVIAKETNVISIADSEENLMLEEESRSKMILKQSDPMVLEKKFNTKPIDYAELNRLSEDFGKRFVPQHELSDEQALHPIIGQSDSSPVKIEAPRELPKIKPNALTEGEWGFEHTKSVFQNEIILFLKTLKDIFNVFDKDLLTEVMEVQIVFNQMEAAVQHSSVDVNTSVNVNSSVAMNDSMNYVKICNKCLELKAELIKQHNMVEKDEYNKLSKRFSDLEQHCISLEIAMQLNKEIFQKNNTSVNQTEPSFDQLFKLNNLKAELQAKDTTIKKLKERIKRVNETSTSEHVKKDFDEVETINIELEHRDIVDNAAQVSNATTIAPGMYKLDPVILAPRDTNNRETHIYYLTHTMEQATILREIVEQAYSLNPLDNASYTACKYVKLIQELLGYVRDTFLDIHKPRVKPSTSASRSKPSGNTKNDRISRPPSNAKALCSICNECLFDANHAMCLIDHVNSMNVRAKSASKKIKKRKKWKPTGKVFNTIGYKWTPTGRTFTLVRNVCPSTRITATNKVPPRVPIPLEVVAPKHVVTRVYTRRPKVPKYVPNSKPKVVQIVLWYLDSSCSKHMTRDCSQLTNFVHKFLGTVKFGNDQVEKIMRYGDYHIGNVTISRVYYVEGLGYNLFSVGQFYDSNIEVAFRKHTCFVCNLEGVDLLSGS
ncbi:hypothetical protein Tco_0627749 [Tanacetum coccineum]|uniref:Retrovirus-related Pol polyprotein from transposon TNT 1-94-like beta-barrel domain-containing protein n=1 Tax=Tanacetum coccineum TaxID=301880 RepID=A0ABQ4WNG0_9ASTR